MLHACVPVNQVGWLASGAAIHHVAKPSACVCACVHACLLAGVCALLHSSVCWYEVISFRFYFCLGFDVKLFCFYCTTNENQQHLQLMQHQLLQLLLQQQHLHHHTYHAWPSNVVLPILKVFVSKICAAWLLWWGMTMSEA